MSENNTGNNQDYDINDINSFANIRNMNSNQFNTANNLWNNIEKNQKIRKDPYIIEVKWKLNYHILNLLKSFKNIPEFNTKMSLENNSISYKYPTFIEKLSYWVSGPFNFWLSKMFDWMSDLSPLTSKVDQNRNAQKKEQKQVIDSLMSANNTASKSIQTYVSTFKVLDNNFYVKTPSPLDLTAEWLNQFYNDNLNKAEMIYDQLMRVAQETHKLSFWNLFFNPFRYVIWNKPIPVLTQFQIEKMMSDYKTSLVLIYNELEKAYLYIEKTYWKKEKVVKEERQKLSSNALNTVKNIKNFLTTMNDLEKSTEFLKMMKKENNQEIIFDNMDLFKTEIKTSLKYIDSMIRKENLKETLWIVKKEVFDFLHKKLLENFDFDLTYIKNVQLAESNYDIIENEINSEYHTLEKIYKEFCSYLWIDADLLFSKGDLVISDEIKSMFLENNPNYIKNLKSVIYFKDNEKVISLKEDNPEFELETEDENYLGELKEESEQINQEQYDEAVENYLENNPDATEKDFLMEQIELNWLWNASEWFDLEEIKDEEIIDEKEKSNYTEKQLIFIDDSKIILNSRLTNWTRRTESILKNKIIRAILYNKMEKLIKEEKEHFKAIEFYTKLVTEYMTKYLENYTKKEKELLFTEKLNQFYKKEEKFIELKKSAIFKEILNSRK